MRDDALDIDYIAQLLTKAAAVFQGNPAFMVNVETENPPPRLAAKLNVDQLQSLRQDSRLGKLSNGFDKG